MEQAFHRSRAVEHRKPVQKKTDRQPLELGVCRATDTVKCSLDYIYRLRLMPGHTTYSF